MLRINFYRQTIAFLVIALASIFLYPAVQAGLTTITWLLLGFIVLAAFITLITK